MDYYNKCSNWHCFASIQVVSVNCLINNGLTRLHSHTTAVVLSNLKKNHSKWPSYILLLQTFTSLLALKPLNSYRILQTYRLSLTDPFSWLASSAVDGCHGNILQCSSWQSVQSGHGLTTFSTMNKMATIILTNSPLQITQQSILPLNSWLIAHPPPMTALRHYIVGPLFKSPVVSWYPV